VEFAVTELGVAVVGTDGKRGCIYDGVFFFCSASLPYHDAPAHRYHYFSRSLRTTSLWDVRGGIFAVVVVV